MKLFVWDFHGVLEKGNEFAVRKITNAILLQNNFRRQITRNECIKLYGLKWYQYFEYVLPEENIDTHLYLQSECLNYAETHPEVISNYIKANDFAGKVVENISFQHDQIVISNTAPKALKMFIESVNMGKYFLPDKAFGADAHSKKTIIKKYQLLGNYLKDKSYEDIIYIGDSAEDIELSNIFKGKTYLYARPGKLHKTAKADYKINDLREILKEL